MADNFDQKAGKTLPGRRWDEERARYSCVDEAEVVVRKSVPEEKVQGGGKVVQRNAILYRKGYRGRKTQQLTVSGTTLSRDISDVVRGAEGTATFRSPSTVRKIEQNAFQRRQADTGYTPKDAASAGKRHFLGV